MSNIPCKENAQTHELNSFSHMENAWTHEYNVIVIEHASYSLSFCCKNTNIQLETISIITLSCLISYDVHK